MTSQKQSNPPRQTILSRLGKGCLVLSVLFILLLSLSSCDNGCEQTRESFLRVTFVSTSGRTMRSIKAICTSGNRQYETKPFSTFTDVTFDLNPAETNCTFSFECTYSDYGDSFSAKETILIDYSSDPRFLDLSCGCTVTYDIQDASISAAPGDENPLFRKLIVNDPHIHTESGTNITIEY